MLSTSKLFVGLLLLAVLAVPIAQADELTDAIPHDALAVVILNNPGQSEQDLQAFVKACGAPGIPFNLDQGLQQMPGLAEVVDRKRPVAAVMVEAIASPVLYVPVKDADAAVEKLETTKEGDYYRVEPKGYLYPKGKYLIAAINSDTLDELKSLEKSFSAVLSPAQNKLRATADVFYWVNIVPYRTLITTGLDNALSQMKDAFAQVARMQRQFNDDEEEAKRQEAMFEQLIEIYSLYFAGLKALAVQTETVHGGFFVSEAAITSHCQIDVTSGSQLQAALNKIKGPQVPLFSDVPNKSFYLAVAGSGRGLAEPLKQFTRAMYKLPAFSKLLEDEELKAAYEASMEAYSGLGDMSFVMDFANGMTAYGAYEVDDPQTLLKQGRESIKISQAMLEKMAVMGQPAMRIKLVEKDKQVEGLKVDEYWMDFEAPNEQVQQMLNAIYGASPRLQVAAQQDKLIFGMGTSQNPIQPMLSVDESLAKNQSVQTALSDLGPSATMVLLVDPFGMLRLMKNIAETQQEVKIDVQLPETTPPPFGASVTVEASGLTLRTSVRSETISELVKLGPMIIGAGMRRN